jgi:predicted kinase
VDEPFAKRRRVADASDGYDGISAAGAAAAYPCTDSSTMSHDPAVLVMVGIPGVGKTTFIEKLIGSCGSVTWVRCSQDDEGSREKCLKKARHALSDGASVAIDRTDFDATQRKHWIDLAHEFGAHTLAL